MLLKILHKLYVILLTLLSGWSLGFLVFVFFLPIAPEDTTSPTDAIVVWTGGACRITTGFELLAQGLSNKLLISGVEPSNVDKRAITNKLCRSTLSAERFNELLELTTLGYEAKTTMGNALETATWAKANGIKSIRLVTSTMHIPRCWIEFRRYLPDVQLIFHPVNIERFDHRQWWQKTSVFIKVLREYAKFVIVALGGLNEWPDALEELKEDQ